MSEKTRPNNDREDELNKDHPDDLVKRAQDILDQSPLPKEGELDAVAKNAANAKAVADKVQANNEAISARK